MKKIFRITGLLLLAGTFIWTLWFLWSKSQTKPEEVRTETAIVTDIIRKTVATGSVIPRREVFIKPQVSGIIEELYVEAGKKVKKGDVIAKVRIIPNLVTLNEAESRLNRSQSSLDEAKVDYNRYQSLFKDQVISPAEFQRYEVTLRNAENEYRAARNNLELIREGVAKSSGQATNTLIRSTLNGMVLDVPVKEGFSVIEANTFNEGTTIASVADMGEMIFEGKVDESEVGKIKTGMDLILTVGAIEGARFSARLEYISPKGKEENGAIQFPIRAAVQSDTSKFLRAGYSANADVILSRKDKVLAIPESVLQFSGDTVYVEVKEGDKGFRKQTVRTGLSDGIMIEVLEGLREKDELKVPAGTAQMGAQDS